MQFSYLDLPTTTQFYNLWRRLITNIGDNQNYQGERQWVAITDEIISFPQLLMARAQAAAKVCENIYNAVIVIHNVVTVK